MAAAKPDSAATAAAKSDPKAEQPVSAAPAPVPSARGGFRAWLPAIAAIVLAPVATWAAVQFAVLPHLQKKIAITPMAPPAAVTDTSAASTTAPEGKGKEKAAARETVPSYDGFQNVVVNLAGTMGTRYLKTSFLVTGTDPAIKTVFEGAKPKLHDVTLNVLSSLTLADLEEPGAKNVIREKLVLAYNQALGRRVAEQVYFSDFVIQ